MAVNLSPVGGVAAQFFTNSGAVLTGGKIFTYAAGTTTPAATYTTSQGNVPWTNPIVLDAAGRVPSGGEIWLTDGIIYKFVLKDANDVLIATYDNISGINSNFVAFVNQQEIITATAGQTVFNLGISYQPATNSLSVFVDGVNQYGPGAQYSYVETDSNTVTFNAGLHVGAEVKFTTTQQQSAGAVDAQQVTYDPPFTGSVATTVQDKLAQTVSLTDFGGAAGSGDNTAAMNAAADYLNSIGGGIILIPYPGEWRMNWVCLYDNITVQGVGGRGEFNEDCIRPYTIASPAITFGDGNSIIRYCGLDNVHISGVAVAGAGAPGVTQYAANANQGLLFRGGVVNFTANRVLVYNGKRSVSIEPSATQPVTGIRFNNGTIRNDITDNNLSRAIYSLRLADPGYNTDNKFILTKVNKPGDGYAAEVDGTITGIAFEVYQSYWDIKPAWGILLKGGSGLVCDDLQLDPGVNGAIIMEADSDGDVGRFITGVMRHGGQKFKFPSYTVDIPAEADTFAYKARLPNAHLGLQTFWGLANDPYNTTTQLVATPGVGGSLRFENADLIVNDEILVRGGNVSNSMLLSAVTTGGGAYMEALGTNQNVRLLASGTGDIVLESTSSARPNSDGVASLGTAGFRWSAVWAVNGTIQTSDENFKQQIGPVDAAVLRAWGKVNYCQYKFNDAVEKKGDKARWHIGVIAQRIQEAFESEGVDPFAYGILCYDEWDDEYEDVREAYTTIEQATGQELTQYRFTGEKRLIRAAGRQLGVRYDEALALECAYLRSKLA